MNYLLKSFLPFVLLFVFNAGTAQPCFPGGIVFNEQSEIDDFPTNYSWCTVIGGNVTIKDGDITNLNGLSQLIEIEGFLKLDNLTNLNSLIGLDNLTSIGGTLYLIDGRNITDLSDFEDLNSIGDLYVYDNRDLESLEGLEGVTSIAGFIQIANNDDLLNTTGLNNLTTVGENIAIYGHNNLNDFSGLNNLETIGDYLRIWKNNGLITLDGFENLVTIGNYLKIDENENLETITNFSNVNSIQGNFEIFENRELLSLDGFENLTEIQGDFNLFVNGAQSANGYYQLSGFNLLEIIEGNFIINQDQMQQLTGFNNLTQIDGNLSISSSNIESVSGMNNLVTINGSFIIQSTHYLENISGFNSLSDIGAQFEITNNDVLNSINGLSNLSTIGGNLEISGLSINDISGLYNLTNIWGGFNIHNTSLSTFNSLASLTYIDDHFYLYSNNDITTMTGFDNLSSIGGYFNVRDMDNLIDFNGLDNLSSIGGQLRINANTSLLSLSNLDNLTSINGYLMIYGNGVLESLDGLQNINPNTIKSINSPNEDLEIISNNSLSYCAIQSICDFLDIPGRTTDIHDNLSGCNTQQEIEDECDALPLPLCTSLTSPLDGSINVNITTDLSWSPATEATGYKLTVGTFSEGTDIENNTDVGNVTTYDPGDFPCGSTIYVTITPYNGSGDAIGCTEESFATESVTASAGSDVAICSGGSTQLQATGGTTYSWSPTTGLNDPNIANPNASPSATTTYTVIVSNDSRCPDTDDVLVTVSLNPIPNASATDETGNNFNDGTATSNPTSGTPTYTYDWSNSETTQIITDLAPGNYTVTVTDANTCTGEETVTVNEYICPTILPNASATDETANNANDGTATVVPTGGTAPYTYAWSNGETTQTITGLAPGNYIVTVTDSKSCTANETTTVAEFVCPTLTIIATQQDAQCNGSCDGSITVTGVTNGVAPFAYSWSNGVTTATNSGLCIGSYTVTVTDDKNCSVSETYIIGESNVLFANASATEETGNDLEDGTATSNPTGGTTPYTYVWSTGEITQIITDLAPEDYTVTITDSHDCTAEETVTVNEFVCATLTIIETQENVSCYDDCDGILTVDDVTNGEVPFDYEWSNGETTQSIDGLCPETYTVTVTDAKNCSVIESYTITEPEELFANGSSTDETANDVEDGTATANPTGGTPPYSYEWSTGETDQTITDLAPGDYTVTLSDVFDCESIETIWVESADCNDLAIIKTKNNLSCFESCDGSIIINSISNGIAPFTYSWNNGKTTSYVDSLCEGIYFVTVSDSENCIVNDSFIISKPTKINANISKTDESNENLKDGTAKSNPTGGNPPYTFKWSNGDTSIYISHLSPGIYSLTLTDASGCSTIDSTTILKFKCEELNLNIEKENISCFDECDGSLNIIVNKTIVITEIMYNSPDEDDLYEYIELYNMSKDTIQMKGYEFTDGIKHKFDSLKLAPKGFLLVAKDSALIKDLGINAIIWDEGGLKSKGETIILTNNNGEVIDSLQYDNENEWETLPDGNGPSLELCDFNKNNALGKYWKASIALLGVNINGKELFGTPGKLNSVVCSSFPAQIENAFAANSDYHFIWNTGDTTSSIKNLCAGLYYVTVTDGNNCMTLDTFEIKEPDKLLANTSATAETGTDTKDGIAACNPTGGRKPYRYYWSTGDSTQTIANLKPDLYYVTVSDANICIAIDSILVQKHNQCTNLSIISQKIDASCYGECDGVLSVSYVNNATPPLRYNWSNEANSNIINKLCAGEYFVTVTDANYCTVIDTFTITQPDEIIITIESVVNIDSNGLGAILLSTNNNGNYIFNWIGPNGFSYNQENIINLKDAGCYTFLVTDTVKNCSIDSTICIKDYTATFDLEFGNINIYPNPTKGNFIIDFSDTKLNQAEITIYDLSGKQQLELEKQANDKILKVESEVLNSGLYIIRIKSAKFGTSFRKILLSK